MAPLATDSGQPPEPWNTIIVADVLDAIDPLTCIRCLHRKDKPGVNTVCATCQEYFEVGADSAERFLFLTCLKIFDFFIWTRRKTLSDNFIVKDDAGGMYIEHNIGVPGDQQRLPSLRAIRGPDGEDGSEGEIQLLSPMRQELLEQVLLTSRQCDNALVLLTNIMRRELLHASSPVVKIEEVLFNACHERTSTHWCYRVLLRDGRQFAVAFADRQLGWLHIVREWDEYVLERFHPWDERDAHFYVENPEEPDHEAVPEDKKKHLSCWKERGVSVRSLGGVLEAHMSQCYPQPDWPSSAVEKWQNQMPPHDMIIEDRPAEWRPERNLGDEEKEQRQKMFGCSLVEDNGGVEVMWDMWKREEAV